MSCVVQFLPSQMAFSLPEVFAAASCIFFFFLQEWTMSLM